MKKLFDPHSSDPYPISRSKLELFLECPRCFYLDRRKGIARPDFPPMSLNLAVDALLKKEFDLYRLREEPHPAMHVYGIDAVPFKHKDLIEWRDKPTGIRSVHMESQFDVFGIVDDVWQQSDGSLMMVDYKATSTSAMITLEHRGGYIRQLEVYQWLFRRNGHIVSDTSYLVFANASREKDMLNKSLEFSLNILPYLGSTDWIDDALLAAKECLMGDVVPPSTSACVWCRYRQQALMHEM